jgi:hypothetical protein
VANTELVTQNPEPMAGDITTQALAMLATAEQRAVIRNEAEDVSAKELRAEIKENLKQWDATRHALTDPAEAYKKTVIGVFKTAMEPAERALAMLDRGISSFFLAQREAARKEQERLDKLAAAKQARLEAKAEAKGEEAPPPIIPMPVVSGPAKTTQLAGGGKVTTALVWTFEVTDAAAVPREWLIVNEQAIGAAVRAGLRTIPGVRIFERPRVG